MKKTSLFSTIVFTAAMAAVNIPVIAQPQNDRLDSLNKKYSYEVCKQYLDILPNTASQIKPNISINYYIEQWKQSGELIPIVKLFPDYFQYKATDNPVIIFPNEIIFSKEFGCPLYVDMESELGKQLIKCRLRLNAIFNELYDMIVSNKKYIDISNEIINGKIDRTLGLKRLKYIAFHIIGDRIIAQKPQYVTVYPINNYNYLHNNALYNTPINNYGEPGMSGPSWNNNSIRRYPLKNKYLSIYDIYVIELQRTNLETFRLILDDHIRRGEPIDISWIPEQTLADIEATKPVRQLKKQIKALEKQSKNTL